MKVLIIPEDQTLDGFVVLPIIERMFADLGRARARIWVLPEPRLRGVDHALDAAMIRRIIAENRMVDLFLLLIDRDCNRYANMERAAARAAEHPGKLITCLAVQEIEVWLLALHRERLQHPWSEIRAECDPKECFAEPLLEELGPLGPGRGRKAAMRGLGAKWNGLLHLCPELADLREKIATWTRTPS